MWLQTAPPPRDLRAAAVDLRAALHVRAAVPRRPRAAKRAAHGALTPGTYVMVLMSDIGYGGDAPSVEADIAKIAFDYFER